MTKKEVHQTRSNHTNIWHAPVVPPNTSNNHHHHNPRTPPRGTVLTHVLTLPRGSALLELAYISASLFSLVLAGTTGMVAPIISTISRGGKRAESGVEGYWQRWGRHEQPRGPRGPGTRILSGHHYTAQAGRGRPLNQLRAGS
jgi:hypothetical protein